MVGYEGSGGVEPDPICHVEIDLYHYRPGGAAVSIRMGGERGPLPEGGVDRERLAQSLKQEPASAVEELLLDQG